MSAALQPFSQGFLADSEVPQFDPVQARAALPKIAMFHPHGFPLELETNSADIMQAAWESWHPFQRTFETKPLRLSLGVSDSGGNAIPAKQRVYSRNHLMTFVGDRENFATCDLRSGYGFGWVSQAVARDHAFLRYHFLEATAMCMLESAHLASIHAALVALGGRGVLLCGESFAGKSTLAYACAREGWTYVTDDGTSLIRNHRDRYAIGNSHGIRLRADAPRLFPELSGKLQPICRNGKSGMEIRTRDLPIATAPGCAIHHVVLLDRRAGTRAALSPWRMEEALQWCSRFAVFGEERVIAEQKRAHRRLMGAGSWRLQYGDLAPAIERLTSLVRGA